jgi:CRP-like cAMP-binding protein
MVSLLQQLPLFYGVGRGRLSALALAGTVRTYERGDVVIESGEAATSVHVILEGQASVVGKATVLGAGDYFGEMALLDGGLRSATIVAGQTLRTLELPRDVFVELLQQEPGLAIVLTAELSWRVRRLEKAGTRRLEPASWPIPGLA